MGLLSVCNTQGDSSAAALAAKYMAVLIYWSDSVLNGIVYVTPVISFGFTQVPQQTEGHVSNQYTLLLNLVASCGSPVLAEGLVFWDCKRAKRELSVSNPHCCACSHSHTQKIKDKWKTLTLGGEAAGRWMAALSSRSVFGKSRTTGSFQPTRVSSTIAKHCGRVREIFMARELRVTHRHVASMVTGDIREPRHDRSIALCSLSDARLSSPILAPHMIAQATRNKAKMC